MSNLSNNEIIERIEKRIAELKIEHSSIHQPKRGHNQMASINRISIMSEIHGLEYALTLLTSNQ